MRKLVWLGVAYAIYVGVENWHKLQSLEETIDLHHKWLLDTFEEAGRHVR